MKLQIDIPEEINNKVKVYKAVNALNGREESVNEILELFFDAPERIKEYFKKAREIKQ